MCVCGLFARVWALRDAITASLEGQDPVVLDSLSPEQVGACYQHLNVLLAKSQEAGGGHGGCMADSHGRTKSTHLCPRANLLQHKETLQCIELDSSSQKPCQLSSVSIGRNQTFHTVEEGICVTE